MKRLFITALTSIVVVSWFACKNEPKQVQSEAQSKDNPLYFPQILPYTEKVNKNPKNAQALFERALILDRYNLDSLALNDLNAAIQLDSTKPEYYSAIGSLMFEHKDITGSTKWFQKAIELDPMDMVSHLNLAKAMIFVESYDEAFKSINIVLRKDAYNPEAYFLKGIIYKNSKDTAKAISSFMTSIQVDPRYKEAMFQIAKIYEVQGNPQFKLYYENAFNADTTDVFPLYALGMALQESNQLEDAKAQYRRCILYDRQFMDAYFNLGYILMHQDSLEKAAKQYDIATKIQIDYAPAYYNRGLCYELMGKTVDAKADYQQALVFDPNYKEALEGIERLKK
jgi:tetratricopeptide (TPR) repeat protein